MNFTKFDIEQLDFRNPYETGGFVSLLSQTAIDLGMHTPTAELNALKHIAGKVVRRLDEELARMSAGEAFMIISAYDLAFRLAYGRGAEQSIVDKYTLKAFEAMIHGDKSVDEYAMYRAIEQAVRSRNRFYMDRPYLWNSISLDRWYKAFRSGTATAPLADYDTVMCVSILLASDLAGYTGREEAFKACLFDNHRHYLDSTDLADPKMLHALQTLLRSASAYIAPDDYRAYQAALQAARLASPATNRYLRETLERQKKAAYA